MEKLRNDQLPLVTVFSTVYNAGKFAIEALESVRANSYPNIEHIIIDDFSKDDSVEIVQKWIDQNNYKCTFVKHGKNLGLCRSLNEILSIAKGKYAFGISDDLLMPEFIESSVNTLEEAGDDYCLCFCDSAVIDEQGNDLGIGYYSSHKISFDTLPKGYAFDAILKSNFVNSVGAMYRTQYVRDIGGYDESLYFEDWDINIRLLKKYKVTNVNRKLTKYRMRKNSMSTANNARYYESLLLICFKIYEFESAARKVLRKKITDFAEYYFKSAGDSKAIYQKAFLKTLNIKVLIFIFFRKLGLSYAFYTKLLPGKFKPRP